MDLVLISYLIAVVVCFSVGVPTLYRAARRRDAPLVLLGAAVTFDAIEWLAWTLANYTPAYETTLGFALSVTCRIFIAASLICMVAFTQVVFRPRVRIAKAFAALIAIMLTLSVAGSGAIGDWEGVRNDHIWVWLEQLALVTGYAWTCIEAGNQYRLGRRRIRYGIGDPLASHRQLLWSVYAGMYVLAQGVYIVTLAFYGMLSDLDTLNAAFTVIGQLALAIAVFAPKPYVNRVVLTDAS